MAGLSATRLLDARRWTREQAESLLGLLRLRPTTFAMLVGSSTWTNMPAALTPLLGRPAGGIPLDMSEYTQIRLTGVVTTAGSSGAVLQARLATTAPLVAGSYAAILASASIASTGILDTGWQSVSVASRVAGFVDVLGSGGDGAADPVLGALTLWVR
jgi:hypothetical protein